MFDPKKPHVKAGFWTRGGDYINCFEQDGKRYDRFGRLLGDDGLPVAEPEEPLPFQEPVEQLVREQGEAPAAEAPHPKAPIRKKPVRKSKK